MRQFSNILFALDLACALLLISLAVPASSVWIAVLSISLSAILANWIRIRAAGLAGIGGLFLVLHLVSCCSLLGVMVVALCMGLLLTAVLLAIFADYSDAS